MVSRRSVLAGGCGVGLVGVSGCLTDSFQSLNEYESAEDVLLEGVRVRELPSGSGSLSARSCVVSSDIEETLATSSGVQLRVERREVESDLGVSVVPYTVTSSIDVPDSDVENVVWLSSEGLNLLSVSSGWRVSVRRTVPSQSIAGVDAAREEFELIEQVTGNSRRDDRLFIAPGGGSYGRNTDKQALKAASDLSNSAWVVRAFSKRDESWFIPSSEIHPGSFPKLAEMVNYSHPSDAGMPDQWNRYDEVVEFTTLDREGIAVGGLASTERKQQIRSYIASAVPDVDVTVTTKGTDSSLLGNRVSDDGQNCVLIAQSESVLEDQWIRVVDSIIQGIQREREQ